MVAPWRELPQLYGESTATYGPPLQLNSANIAILVTAAMHANNLPSTDRLVQLSPAQPQYRESILSLTIVLLTCCRLRIPARAMSLFTRKAVLRRLVEFSELPLPMCRLPASLLVPPRLSRVPVRALSSASSASLPSRVGVVGGGQMGTGIAYVSSVLSALPVVVVDSRPSQLDSSRAMVRALLDKDERKGKLSSAARREAENRLTFTSDINQVRAALTHSQQATIAARQPHSACLSGVLSHVAPSIDSSSDCDPYMVVCRLAVVAVSCALCVSFRSARVRSRPVHYRGRDGECGCEKGHLQSTQRYTLRTATTRCIA